MGKVLPLLRRRDVHGKRVLELRAYFEGEGVRELTLSSLLEVQRNTRFSRASIRSS